MSGPQKWTKEACALEAAKHMSRKAFSLSCVGAYQAAIRYGWMDEISGHMMKRPRKVHATRVPARIQSGHVYFLLRPDGLLKIGFSIDLWSRVKEHGLGCELIGAVPGTPHDEYRTHAEFGQYRLPRAGAHGHAPELFMVPEAKLEALRQSMRDHGLVPPKPPGLMRRAAELAKRRAAVRPVTYTFTCDRSLPERIDSLSAATGVPVGAIMAQAIEQFIAAQSITRTEAA